MPVADGLLGKQRVRVLGDTGCSTVVVRRSLISEENLTGQEETCVLKMELSAEHQLLRFSLTRRTSPGPPQLSVRKVRYTTSSLGTYQVPRILLLRTRRPPSKQEVKSRLQTARVT